MPRKTRLTVPTLPHLVGHRGHNGSPVFRSGADRRVFMDALAEAAFESGCAVHAYALLPGEVLVLGTPATSDGLARLMQALGRRYARYFNSAYARSGALWDGRYKHCVVEPLGALLCAYRYVDEAPVRAGLAQQAIEFRWSSARAHLGLEATSLLADHITFARLGASALERARAYRKLLECPLNESALGQVDAALSGCLAFGCERFKDALERRFQRRVRAGHPGRPRRARARLETRAHGPRPGEVIPEGVTESDLA